MDSLSYKAQEVLSLFDLTGKTAMVTGGGKGLGEAMVLALAGAGADVVPAGKTFANVERVAQEVTRMGRRALPLELEVQDPQQVSNIINRVLEEFGKLDILVNCAGFADVHPITDFPLEQWQYIMDTNVKGTFLCSREAAKHMLKQGSGKIINISSLQGSLGRAGDPAYSASKAAVNLMTKSMACEWGSRGICVNAISPTWCWTDLTTPLLQKKDFYREMQKRIPAGRAGNREDIFGMVVFLASRASDFVNGAIIPLDGGASASDGFPPVPGD